MRKTIAISVWALLAGLCAGQATDNIGHQRHFHRHGQPHETVPADASRFVTNRQSGVDLSLPKEEDAFFFVVFGDRTGGPAEGVSVLADAVRDTNMLEPDLVMTVGDLVQGYNQTDRWMTQMEEFKGIMSQLLCPWFPVAGNHDIYWRGEGRPTGEHESSYEMYFGPLWYGFKHKNCGFIALYSDEGNPATLEKNFNKPECNVMSPEQLTWLQETLAEFKDLDHVFLFLHHPRWIGGGNYGDTWEPVHKVLVEAGNVTAVFGGHIHNMRSDPRDGIEYVSLATVGGAQPGTVPEAGYLHQFHIVTVRKDQIALASVPVGEVMDVREITGELNRETVQLAEMEPTVEGGVTISTDGGGGGEVKTTISNPTSRPIEVVITPESADNWWTYLPDHAHAVIEPGAEKTFAFRIDRLGGVINDRFCPADLVVSMDCLAAGHRYAIPETRVMVPMEVDLPAPSTPDRERVLAVDGKSGHLALRADQVPVKDGPLTVECWMRADGFADRVGLLAKTESSEYGIFVNKGRPAFSVHLDGKYVEVGGKDGDLEVGQWYHVAGVYDGREVRLYVNGQLVEAKPGIGKRTTNALPLMIGADVSAQGGMTSPFDGQIDGVRISEAARYAGASFRPVRRLGGDAQTVLLLNFDGQVGAWAYDESGREAHPLIGAGVELVEE